MVASAEYDPIVVEAVLSDQKVRELVEVARESAKLDYKRAYDPKAKQSVVELIKDIVAMANTAGGYIVVGIDDDGAPHGLAATEIAALDEATLRGQIESIVGAPLEIFLNAPVTWGGQQLAVITVLRSPRSPVVFEKDGQYPLNPGSARNHTVFRAGDVFVRHGSKSERWNNDDVRTIYARIVGREKERWLGEVLPDVRRLIGDSLSARPLQPSARDQLSEDAETFEQSLRDALRRSK